ncbi:MAG: DUF697 domain-containing protein [Bacilli bacterium]|nr:DUF697 domain-containing protein [Bacilli bacterium]
MNEETPNNLPAVVEEPKNKGPKKMTLEEYKDKYTKPYNAKAVRSFLVIFAGAVGVVVFTCLLLIVLRVFEMNQVAGYISIAPAVLAFVFLYVVPLVKIARMKSFIVNVDERNAHAAKRHNKAMRESIADKMIDFNAKTENIGWYDAGRIGQLAVARQTHDDAELKAVLTEIFDKDVRKSANRTIRKAAVKVGLYTALSQSDKLDTAIVGLYSMNLIKDIIYLYGYRPSEPKLMRIYAAVLRNALIAYGASASSAGLVQKTLSGVMDKLGALGAAVSMVVGSASQGVINGVLLVVVGCQCKRYLKNEYHLQDILDEIDLGDDNEAELMDQVRKEILTNTKEAKNREK